MSSYTDHSKSGVSGAFTTIPCMCPVTQTSQTSGVSVASTSIPSVRRVTQTTQTSGVAVTSTSIPSRCPVEVPVTQASQTSGITQGGIQSTNIATVPNMTHQLTGASFPGLPDIVQWMFPEQFSQSTIGGRTGSNA